MRPSAEPSERAATLMSDFAERTGLTSGQPPRRYLWTDAFAVCNLLGLARIQGDAALETLALKLVDQVHHVLGRHRADDPRSGWLSGLEAPEAELHPTRGGLRIGKPLRERRAEEPYDERTEWDRDGQYFHYLTRWMHALDQAARHTGRAQLNTWARELAEVAHVRFTRGPAGARRMVWKLSVDLTRPLVPSMGQHDPIDGLVTCRQLLATAARLPGAPRAPELAAAIEDFGALTDAMELTTGDPLGLGGLLTDAWRVAELVSARAWDGGALLERLLDAAHDGLRLYARFEEWREPASRRLAFRELGLALGLEALQALTRREREDPALTRPALRTRLDALAEWDGLGPQLRDFWLEPENRRSPPWAEHRDINDVMLATCLAPEGYLHPPPMR